MPAEKIPAGRAPGMFSAPRGRSRQPMAKMTAPGLHDLQAPLPADAGDKQAVSLALQVHHRGGQPVGDLQLFRLFNKPGGVFRAGQLLLKGVQAKAVCGCTG